MRHIAAILAILVAIVGNVRGAQGAEPGSDAVDPSRFAPTVASGHSAGEEPADNREQALGSRSVPAQSQTADHVRLGVTGSLLNYGNEGHEDEFKIAAWSPGGELFVAVQLERWLSIGLRVGYQQFNGTLGYTTRSTPPRREMRVLGELSAHAPLLQDRLELGARVGLGGMRLYAPFETNGVEASLSGTAVYWFCSWLGGLSEISGSANMYGGPGGDPGEKVPYGIFLLSWKVGALVRF